jgi:hypothetical protein
MYKILFILIFSFAALVTKAQLIDVQYNYNNVGDCSFGASNNAKTPLFMHLYFTNLENTRFTEPLPYVKKLEPGYTGLFILQREMDMDAPSFIFEIETFRSNPIPDVNLDFPYLIPFEPGTKIEPFDVQNIDGFWGDQNPEMWRASGFFARQGDKVYAARQGQIVEIVGETRKGDPKTWYNTWTNSITLLQPDGTLITYKNVVDKNSKLELNQKIHAGEILGEIESNSSELVIMIYHNVLKSSELQFVIPVFVTAQGKTEILNPSLNIEVVHPIEIRVLEMTKKEQKKLLKIK